MNRAVRLNHSFEFRSGGVFTCSPRWRSPYGAEGKFIKIYLPFEGEAEIRSEKKGWTSLLPGKLYVIPAYLPHAYRCAREMRLAWLHVNPTEVSLANILFALQDVLEFPGMGVGEDHEMESLVSAAEMLGEKPGSPDLSAFLNSKEQTLNLQAFLLRLSAKCLPYTKGLQQGMVTEMAKYLEAHLHQSLDMAAMVKKFDRSEGFLRKSFREQVGETPQKYHERHRILRAQQLLWEEKDQVSIVARKCGWDDPLYFSKVFKSKTGLSPREYRKRVWQP